jgi:hypothetical protein
MWPFAFQKDPFKPYRPADKTDVCNELVVEDNLISIDNTVEPQNVTFDSEVDRAKAHTSQTG